MNRARRSHTVMLRAVLNIVQRGDANTGTNGKAGNAATITKGYIRKRFQEPHGVWLEFSPKDGNLFVDDEQVDNQSLNKVLGLPDGVSFKLSLDWDNARLIGLDGKCLLPEGSDGDEQVNILTEILADQGIKSLIVEWDSDLAFNQDTETYLSSVTGVRVTQTAHILQATITLCSERHVIGGIRVSHEELVGALKVEIAQPRPTGLAAVQAHLSKVTVPQYVFQIPAKVEEEVDDGTSVAENV